MGLRQEIREELEEQERRDRRVAQAHAHAVREGREPEDFENWPGGMMSHRAHVQAIEFGPWPEADHTSTTFGEAAARQTSAKEQYPLLWELWQQIWPSVHTPQAVESGFEKMISRYQEDHRRYHTLEHIQHFAEQVQFFQGKFNRRWPAVLLAMFYHDAVYNAEPGKDEEASIAVMYRDAIECGLSVSNNTMDAERLIRHTIKHDAPKRDRVAQLFLDIDMSILAALPHQYDAYAARVREEYSHRYTPKDFDMGRSAFLDNFLGSGKKVFHTPEFEAMETEARSNMERELAVITVKLAANAYTQ